MPGKICKPQSRKIDKDRVHVAKTNMVRECLEVKRGCGGSVSLTRRFQHSFEWLDVCEGLYNAWQTFV
jgi:hypothetical protein